VRIPEPPLELRGNDSADDPPQTRERVNFIAIPKSCVTTDDDVGSKHVSDTEDYIRANVTIGANLATFSNFSAWFDNR
jgi:hypothetical protein